MKPKNIFLTAITFLLCAFFFTSCEEKEKVWTELPPATQTGANTIGCLVDGQLWATSRVTGTTFAPAINANYLLLKDSSMLDFNANGRNGGMAFFIKNPKLGENIATHIRAKFRFKEGCMDFEKDTIGTVTITKLETNLSTNYTSTRGIISGTFSCQLPCETNLSNYINITDGRFDLVLSVQRAFAY